jgi:riboflavin synthase
MFTGIIEETGQIKKVLIEKSNRTFHIESKLASDLKVDESVSHNGICLTVEEILNNGYKVTAIEETLQKTNAGLWKANDIINLERSMKLNGRLDGHIVQGHVDGTGICIARADMNGSVEFIFQYDEKFAPLSIEKGSICVNGVSLTAFDVTNHSFKVAIIPYTLAHTNFGSLKETDLVNLEFDVLGKYVARFTSLHN